MKKLALIMMFSTISVVLSAEEYTIQAISAQKEASITPAFEKKIEKSALPVTKKKEGTCNIVTVGKYPSVKAAKQDLAKAKAISKDAFVRSVERATPKGCENTNAVKANEKKASVEQTVNKTVAVQVMAVQPKKEEVVAVVTPVVQPVAASVAQENKSEPCKTKPCENVVKPVYVYDRNLARKSDIEDAIEYYKRSPYYTFKPVLTQRN
ncbi:hypothetical protein [Sulfuricurvum sp. PD_MW2]|uniref:hypothetical protein n=1 Tax=Sulfuricurvum sp. PD_MW2 TaxID=2027917 RepID=UPI0025FD0C1B|nr:hypothetical protein [Sulfuricurvum sp. PD_MW2]